MYIAYTPEQEALRAELRAYFASIMTPEVEAEVATRRHRRAALPGGRPEDGPRRLARHRLAEGVRRPGPRARRAVHLLRRGVARAGADPGAHHQRDRADDHGVRQRGAEAVLPAAHPAGRAALRRRLHRAAVRHRPGVAADPRGARRRRLGDQRPEDLHQPRRLRGLHLARGPHRPRRAEAQGHLDLRGAHQRAGLLVLDHPHAGRRPAPPTPSTTTCGCRRRR